MQLLVTAPLFVHADLASHGFQTISQFNHSSDIFFGANGISRWDPNVTSFLLSGWHSNFSDNGSGGGGGDGSAQCSGTYAPVSPRALDTSGQTCYVNPHAEADVSPGVVWFAVLPPFSNGSMRVSFNGVYAWYVIFDRTANFSHYMPGPCDDTGACECRPFNTVRSGWNLPTNSPDLLNFTENDYIDSLVIEKGIFSPDFSSSQCNVQMVATNSHVKERFAVLPASLVEVPITPTLSPTTSALNMPTISSSLSIFGRASLVLPMLVSLLCR